MRPKACLREGVLRKEKGSLVATRSTPRDIEGSGGPIRHCVRWICGA